jgi:hypothetical protein
MALVNQKPHSQQGLVKVVLSTIENPSKSPFFKGRLYIPLLKKGAVKKWPLPFDKAQDERLSA